MLQRLKQISWSRLAGEFLIIVVGILVAITVDRANENRRERSLEAQYLQALRTDLELDLVALRELDGRTLRRAAAATRLLRELGQDATQPDNFSATAEWRARVDSMASTQDLRTALDWSGRVFRLETGSPTFDELTSTGNLRLITNADLKRRLSEYYRVVESTRFLDEEQADVVWSGYHPLLRDRGIVVWDIPHTDQQLRTLVNQTPSLGSHARRVRTSFYVQHFFLQPLPSAARDIIAMIDAELAAFD